ACQDVGFRGYMRFIAPGVKWKKLTRCILQVLSKNGNQLGDNRTNNLEVGVLVYLIACKIRREAFSNVHASGKSDIAINNKNFSMAAQVSVRHAHTPGVCHEQRVRNTFSPEAPDNRWS